MKWVAGAIVVFIVGYTFLSLEFRKPNRAYEPYNDLKNRGQTHTLLTAGFQRIALGTDQPTNLTRPATSVATQTTPGGIPEDLRQYLFDQPRLPDACTQVFAPANASSILGFPLIVECTAANQHQQIAGAFLYVQGDRIIIAPEFEPLDGELTARSRQIEVRLTVPGGAIKPGSYEVLLTGRDSSLKWRMQVN